jgi:GT2 family glycosyltransferase
METPVQPCVSIIIITCNRPFLLKESIERVQAQPYTRKELIVVDSSPNDESEQVIASYSGVRCVRLRGQRNNMPQARNAGLAIASGDICAFIDDDSMVRQGWLEALLDAYVDETVGAVGGRIISMPAPYSEQEHGTPHLLVSSDGRVTAKGAGLVSSELVEVDHLTGCNMSFRRAALEQVGGFDPGYTLTNLREETDLCVRVKRAGWRIVFQPAMAVVHFSPRSLQPYFLEKPGVQFSNGRNGSYFAIKHFGLTPQTMKGQLLDAGRACGRAAYFIGLFGVGTLAQLAGRAAGVSAGVSWHLSKKRQAASSPSVPANRDDVRDTVEA